MRLPPDFNSSGAVSAGECLETPPPFFGDSRPFLNGADSEVPSRQSRREARRAERRGEAPAEAQPGAVPPEPADPPPSDNDRVIDN